jgi:uncharacterized metal-binding protein YceD (DUF177 family)
MPLLVNILKLASDTVFLKGELPVEELQLDVNDEVVQARTPLQYDLEVQKLEQSVLAQGSLRLKLDCQCVRCLKPLELWVDLTGWACHLPLEGEDAVPVVNDSVDLTPHIREDILLGFPQHPACEPECGGLTDVSRGKSKITGGAGTALPSSAWSELDKLKHRI